MEAVSAVPRLWLILLLLALALWVLARVVRLIWRRGFPPPPKPPRAVTPRPDPVALSVAASALFAAGRAAEAEPLYRAALAAQRGAGDARSPTVAARLENLGAVLAALGRQDEAEAVYFEAVCLRRDAGDDPAALASSLDGQAQALLALGRLPEAEDACREALAVRGSDPDEDPVGVAVSLDFLARIVARAGRPAEAIAPALQALAQRRAGLGDADGLTRDSAAFVLDLLRSHAPDHAELPAIAADFGAGQP